MTRPHPKIVRLALLVLVPIVVVPVGGVIWLHGGRTVGTDDAYVKTDMAQIASEVSGRVSEVLVRDHQVVEADTPLLKLDPEPFQLAVDKAEAELDKARTEVETARAQWRETENELREAENRTEYMMREAARQRALAVNGNAAMTKLDEAQNAATAARDRVRIVKSRLARMLATLGGDPEMPTDEHPLVREKKAERDSAKLDLERTTIKAPIGGTAVNVKLQPGEQVRAATPLFVLVSKTRPWVEANMKETDLTHVKPGQKASVVLDIYPDVAWDAEVDEHQPGDRSRVRDPAAAKRLRQLGQGRPAAAGAGPAVAVPGRAAATRRDDRDRDDRHQPPAQPRRSVGRQRQRGQPGVTDARGFALVRQHRRREAHISGSLLEASVVSPQTRAQCQPDGGEKVGIDIPDTAAE